MSQVPATASKRSHSRPWREGDGSGCDTTGQGQRPATTAPVRVSIVIASEQQETDVRRCLQSLADQLTSADETIVVHSGSPMDPESMARDHPHVLILAAPEGASVPDLRYRGLERARGEIVAMTEAAAMFAPGWLERVVALHGGGYDAVGGAIDPAPDLDGVSWAAHLCEYGAYMSPVIDCEGGNFSGFHSSYKRSLLGKCETSIRGRHWEGVLHEEARRLGGSFFRCGDLRLLNARRHTVGSFLRQQFAYGRGFGRVRGQRSSPVVHAVLLVATVGLPALMMYRYGRWIVAKRLPPGRSIVSLPLLLLFACGWSMGEWVGYLDAIRERLRSRAPTQGTGSA